VIASRIRRYFEGGISSVFLWDLEDGSFAGVVLLKEKDVDARITVGTFRLLRFNPHV